MNVALLGDVHANLHALEAVLLHARQQKVEAIWNVGDFVGYAAFPDEVVRCLRGEGAISIIGNYDLKVLRFKKKRAKWRKSKRPEKWLAFQWAYENLSKASRKYLRGLPQELRFDQAGWRFLLTHGSPASNEEPLTTITSDDRLRELGPLARAQVIICGHSHEPFVRQANGWQYINTGSVGRPGDGDPRACYAVLRLEDGDLQVRHYRVPYDVAGAVEAIRARGLPEIFAQMLLEGLDFDSIHNS